MRLNNEHRERITKEILKRKFDPQKEQIQAKKYKAAYAIYLATYDKALRNEIAKLPEGWLIETSTITFVHYSLNYTFSMRNKVRILAKHTQGVSSHSLSLRHAQESTKIRRLKERLVALDDEHATVLKQERQAARIIIEALSEFATDTKLIKGWPEIADIVKAVCFQPENSTARPKPEKDFLAATSTILKAMEIVGEVEL